MLMKLQQVGLAEGTFYPAVHTVLGGWYTKQGSEEDLTVFWDDISLTILCRTRKKGLHIFR